VPASLHIWSAQCRWPRATASRPWHDTPSPFEAVGLHYLRFPQVDDDEVLALLAHR
jgi:hypothetical protein